MPSGGNRAKEAAELAAIFAESGELPYQPTPRPEPCQALQTVTMYDFP